MNTSKITYHRDGTITFWDVYQQRWTRTDNPSDQQLSTLPLAQVDKIKEHVSKAQEN
jgi:hypothetical protein